MQAADADFGQSSREEVLWVGFSCQMGELSKRSVCQIGVLKKGQFPDQPIVLAADTLAKYSIHSIHCPVLATISCRPMSVVLLGPARAWSYSYLQYRPSALILAYC